MANENTLSDDDDALPDPFEAELIAYLDGELDAAAARKVEARLATDPNARAQAASLQKSFDMLDYLPKPEPSPNFTTRTLEKLPAIKAPTKSGAAEPASKRAAASTSMPVAIPDEDDEAERELAPARPFWQSMLGPIAAVFVFALGGYLLANAIRPALFANRDTEHDTKNDPDPRVIEYLPLYAIADDIHFVQELATSDLFGDDPAVAFDPNLKIPQADTSNKPGGKEFDALARAFRALPHTRQSEIVKLDQDLHGKEPRERDRLFRALEAYAVWLERLPEAERRGILAAATPSLRLGVIREVREQLWMDALPPPLRKKIDSLTNANEKAELIAQWKEEENIRRDHRAFIRQHAEAFAANKSPWPFDTEAGRKEVIEFAKTVFKVDDNRRTRLSPEDLIAYRASYNVAERDNAWAWYGLQVYELSKKYPYLPEPHDAKQLYTEPNELPEFYARSVMKKGGGTRINPRVIGKWPEFPLEVLKEAPLGKFLPPNLAQLGPAKLSDYKENVRTFVTKELYPKLTSDEKNFLQRIEGKWPEHPQRMLQYANKYDLAVPGVTLPGSPRKWENTYGMRTNMKTP